MENSDLLSRQLQPLLLPILTGVLTFIIYTLTLAPDLTWANFGGDGGDLITAATTFGVPHPPGYPFYVLLGKLVSLIPIGNVAWRFNLFSAFAASTATTFVTATASYTLNNIRYRELVSLATGLSVGLTPLVWGQALITEVYSLNLAVLSIFLWTLLTHRPVFITGLFLGLGITTHLSSLLMLPLGFALSSKHQWKGLIISTIFGLFPLLFLPIFARLDSPVVWGDPSTFINWWNLVTGRIYLNYIRVPTDDAFIRSLTFLGSSILRQFAWAGWLIIVLGITTKIVDRQKAIWLLFTSTLYIIYGFFYRTEDVIVNLLPIFLLLSPLLAAGLSRTGVWVMLFPLGLLIINLSSTNLHKDNTVRPLAIRVLDSAPENAILLTPGDQSIFTLWYFHHVEGIREDLYLVDANLFAFDWYRERLNTFYPELAGLEKDDLEAFRIGNGRVRPFCDVPADLAGAATCMPRSEAP